MEFIMFNFDGVVKKTTNLLEYSVLEKKSVRAENYQHAVLPEKFLEEVLKMYKKARRLRKIGERVRPPGLGIFVISRKDAKIPSLKEGEKIIIDRQAAKVSKDGNYFGSDKLIETIKKQIEVCEGDLEEPFVLLLY